MYQVLYYITSAGQIDWCKKSGYCGWYGFFSVQLVGREGHSCCYRVGYFTLFYINENYVNLFPLSFCETSLLHLSSPTNLKKSIRCKETYFL
jgi:hypothetical protein